MELGLSRKAFSIHTDLFFRIQHNLHVTCIGIQFDQISIVAVLRGPDVDATIPAFDDGKVATFLTRRFLRNTMRSRPDPVPRRLLRQIGIFG